MNCKNCGSIIPEGQSICPVCGTDNNILSTPTENIENINPTVNEAPAAPTTDTFVQPEVSPVIPEVAPIEPVTPEVTPEAVPTETVTPAPVEEPSFEAFTTPAVAPEVTPVQPEVVPVTPEVAPVTPEVAPVAPEVVSEPAPIAEPATPEVAPINIATEPIPNNNVSDFATPNVAEQPMVDNNTPAPKKGGNKTFTVVVIILIIAILGLGVGLYLKNKNSNSDTTKNGGNANNSNSNNSNNNGNNNKKTEITVEPKDPTTIVVTTDEPKSDDNRNKVNEDPTTPTKTTTEDPVITTTTGNEIEYNLFTYGNIRFRIPTYVSVSLDPDTNDYYITDNQVYDGVIVLFAANFDNEILADKQAFLTNNYTNLGFTPIDIQTGTLGNVKIALVSYVAAGSKYYTIFLSIGNEVIMAVDFLYLNENYTDYMLGDLIYMATYNDILGSFSKSNLSGLSTFKANSGKAPTIK